MEELVMGWMTARAFVHIGAGVCIFVAVWSIFSLGYDHHWMKRGCQYVYEQTKQSQSKRRAIYQQQYEEVGLVEKLPLIQRWDQAYSQSMIQYRFPALNTELFSGILVIAGSVAGICGLCLCRNSPGLGVLVGLAFFGVTLAVGVCLVHLLRRSKWKQTEKELMPFLNIVDNFSKSEQDLFQIFELAVPYLKGPIKSAIGECSQYAASTGNRMEAIRDLLYRVEHPKFREIVQNLEICSKNDGNYGAIMQDMREGLSSYLSNRKEEAGIWKQGQIQMIVILCLGIPMVTMLSVVTQVPLSELAHNLFGRIIIGYWIVLLLFILYQMFFAVAGGEA